MPLLTSAFDLPDRLVAKADPALIGDDERHFAAVADSLEHSLAELSARLEAVRRAPAAHGQEALERDLEVHRISTRLRTLRRYRLDLCLGRMVRSDGGDPVYIGRLGLADSRGRQLLVDWRTPAAAPFFRATLGDPMGLRSRRRYRWTAGRISDYWDEVFTPEDLAGNPAVDDETAFLASLGASRSPRMRDVLGTIQADQDAIIRAGSRGALVVDGGPGTGKTVVALHRAAYLLYSDPRLAPSRGGVLFVGPHEAYLAYVADVLPSLGEESVQTCTLRDLVPGARALAAEEDREVARLKSSAKLVGAVEAAVRAHEQPPAAALTVSTPWTDVRIGRADWAEAFAAAEAGSPHNGARAQVWEELIDIAVDQLDEDDGELPLRLVRRSLLRSEELRAAFSRAWPLLDPEGIVRDLWSRPDVLRRAAPWLSDAEVAALQRGASDSWTRSDLPFLDAARLRVGDPGAPARLQARAAALAAEREQRDRVLDELIASDDSEMLTMWILRGEDAKNSLVDEGALPQADPDLLSGPFAHIMVDEAQELTDAEWQMLLRRCPSRSFTIVGDRAQARQGFPESWQERLRRIGLDEARVASLTINYRTPEEVMAEAAPVIRAALPDANVPISIRSAGVPVLRGARSGLAGILDHWLATHPTGTACVIGDADFCARPRVRSLSPEGAKGLEFDLVVLVEPERFGAGVEGAVDRYVAMTRATQQLVLLTSESEPEGTAAPTDEAIAP